MTKQLLKHSDLDSQILQIDSPVKLALQLGCLATGLIAVVTWLALFGAMSSGLIRWQAWPYAAGPVVAWVLLLGLPALLSARRGALSILSALATTAEAWLARAGYSVDLNHDGYVGHYAPNIAPVETHTVKPVLYSGPGGVKLLARTEQAIPDVAEQASEETPARPLKRELWELPGGVKCPRETLENFIERVFVVGWGRGDWVGQGKPLDRETYDGLINLLCQAQIIEGRRAGFAGKLTINDPATARQILGLTARSDKPAAALAGDDNLIGKYEHI